MAKDFKKNSSILPTGQVTYIGPDMLCFICKKTAGQTCRKFDEDDHDFLVDKMGVKILDWLQPNTDPICSKCDLAMANFKLLEVAVLKNHPLPAETSLISFEQETQNSRPSASNNAISTGASKAPDRKKSKKGYVINDKVSIILIIF